MKWIAISGSWRTSSPELEHDVREAVASIMRRGEGIVAGGALGVDYLATIEALQHDPAADRIRVIIPTPLDTFAAHYRQRAAEGVITSGQAEALIALLTDLKHRSRQALIEMQHQVLTQETYYDRNAQVIAAADALLAFQVNGSLGTQDAIDKARAKGLEIEVKQYAVS